MAAVLRTEAKKTRPTRRCRAPELDCSEEEEEEANAVLLVRLDLLPAAGIDGGVRRRPRLIHGHGASAARVSCGEEKEGEREQAAAGVVFMLQGGAWDEEGARGGHGSTASMAPVLPLAPQ